MVAYAFQPASPESARHIAQHLRAADRIELEVTHPGTDVGEILEESVRISDWATVVTIDGEPALVYGVAPGPKLGVGLPWLLATDRIVEVSREFLRRSRGEVSLMGQGYSVLINCVHRDNDIAIRWLTWCGFTVMHEKPAGELLPFFKET